MDQNHSEGQGFQNPAIAGDSAPRGNAPEKMRKLQTRGRWVDYVQRPTIFTTCAGSVGDLIHDHEGAAADAGRLRIALVGPAPWVGIAGARAWAEDADMPITWEIAEAGHYLHGAHPVFRYRSHYGDEIEVIRAASWFGEGSYSAELAREAWVELGRRIGERFRGAVMLSTPATVGRDTLLRSLNSRTYPVLPDDLQELIRSTSGQGRIEVFPAWRGSADTITDLVEYDGRLMYAGCVAELPSGDHVYDHGRDFLGYTRARYDVSFTVPQNWFGPGLLGLIREGAWVWPKDPGDSGRTWVDGAELQIALAQGWPVVIHRRLYWPHRGRPLDAWSSHLVACLADLPTGDLGKMLRAGVRSIVLHGIGALHGRGYRVSHSSEYASDVPSDAVDPDYDPDSMRYTWATVEQQRWPEMSHPEWTSATWARARARLLTCPTGMRERPAGMLHVDPRRLVACRTDAVYMTSDPGWYDDGAPGRLTFRRGGMLPAGTPWPTSHRELLDLRGVLEDGPFDLSSDDADVTMEGA